MNKNFLLIAAAGIALFGTLPAMAHDHVDLSLSIGNVAPAPVVVAPPPTVYTAPAPVVVAPPPVVYRPRPVVVEAAPVVEYRHDNGWHHGWRERERREHEWREHEWRERHEHDRGHHR